MIFYFFFLLHPFVYGGRPVVGIENGLLQFMEWGRCGGITSRSTSCIIVNVIGDRFFKNEKEMLPAIIHPLTHILSPYQWPLYFVKDNLKIHTIPPIPRYDR